MPARGAMSFTAEDPKKVGDFFDHCRRIGEVYGVDLYGCHWDGIPEDLLDTIEPVRVPGTRRAI